MSSRLSTSAFFSSKLGASNPTISDSICWYSWSGVIEKFTTVVLLHVSGENYVRSSDRRNTRNFGW